MTERQILVALMAQKLQKLLQDSIREHGEFLKLLGVDVKTSSLNMLSILEEAVELLKKKAQQKVEK